VIFLVGRNGNIMLTSERISWNARKWIGSESAIVPSISNNTAFKSVPCGSGDVFVCSAPQNQLELFQNATSSLSSHLNDP